MANVEFLEPTGANVSPIGLSATGSTSLTPGHGEEKAWVYSNYPEGIEVYTGKGLAIADQGHYLNQQMVSGEAEVFFSHANYSPQTLECNVQLYNPNAHDVNVTILNCGARCPWGQGEIWKDYFSSSPRQIKLGPESAQWVLQPALQISAGTPKDQTADGEGIYIPFSGVVHLNVEGADPIVVTVYAYHDIGEVDGLASTFEYSFGESGDPAEGKDYPPVYTGLGDEFNLAFNHGTILTNSLEDQPYKYTTTANDSNNVNIGEIIPIKILGENLTASVDKSESSGLNNLANWCVHNFHNITFKNPTSRSVTIYGYISGAAKGATTVINYDGETYYTEMSSNMGLLTWRWCKITLAPNETFNFSYQHILATHSNGCQVTEWRLE